MIAALFVGSFLSILFLLQVTGGPTDVEVDTGAAQLNLQMLIAFVSSGFITFMKSSKWPIFSWIGNKTPLISKFVSAVAAAGVTLGIVVTSTGVFNSTEGMTVTIVGLSLTGMVKAFSTFISQWIFNHVSYTAIWKKNTPTVDVANKV